MVDRSINISSLKKCSSESILLNMIRTTKEKINNQFLILILDDFTAKIISSFVTMTDVLNEGVFSVERLDTVRQKFPKYHGLYFISPQIKSIEKINEDFSDESKPQYSRAHIFFSHRVADSILGQLATQNTYPRIMTCIELNISFLIKNRNLFDLGMGKAMEIFSLKNKENSSKVISSICERLFTVCAVLREYPYVQYQKTSTCTQLATILDAQLKEFYKEKGHVHNDKRGTVLILDRTFDVTTPFLHDYNYETMVYDLFDVKDDTISIPDSKNVYQKYKLDDKDELWMKYKNKHMVVVFKEIGDDFKEFVQGDASKVIKRDEAQSFEDMADVLHSVKDFNTKNALFSLHLKIAEEMSNKYKSMNLNDVIEIEQDIVSGINSDGSAIENKKIMNKYTNLNKSISEEERLRILLTMHSCLDFSENDFTKLLQDIKDNTKHRSIYNLGYLGINFSKNKGKSGRRLSGLNKNEKLQFINKSKSIDYNFLRTSPKLENLAIGCSKIELNNSEFPFVSEIPKAVKNYSGNMFGGSNSDEELPNLIIFVIGGISHSEIACLEGIFSDKEKKLNHKLVLGSTSIISAKDYIRHLSDLPTESENNSQGVTEIKSIELQIVD